MLKKSLVMAALLFAFGACASADTTWYLDNVTIVQLDYLGNPVYNNTVNGNFVIDTAGTSLVSWDVDVEGTNTQANYHYKSAPLNSIGVFNVANQVDFGGSGFNPFLDLYFLNPLSAGPPDPLVDAIACPGCTDVVVTGSVTNTDPNAVVPEPGAIILLSTVAGFLALRHRRARVG